MFQTYILHYLGWSVTVFPILTLETAPFSHFQQSFLKKKEMCDTHPSVLIDLLICEMWSFPLYDCV